MSCLFNTKCIFCWYRLCKCWPPQVFNWHKLNVYHVCIQELSGLGKRRLINSQAVDDRFKNIGEVAKTHSIISLGLTCFKLKDLGSNDLIRPLNFDVQTFNLMALCAEDYIVEPSALQVRKWWKVVVKFMILSSLGSTVSCDTWVWFSQAVLSRYSIS